MKLDFKNIKPLDIHDMKVIRMMAAAFLLIILGVDVFLFSSIRTSIKHSKERQEALLTDTRFFNALMSKKSLAAAVKLYPKDKIEEMVDRFYTLAEQNKIALTVNENIADGKESTDQYTCKVLVMDAVGSMKDLGAFLTAVNEVHDALLVLKSINITNKNKDVSRLQSRIVYILFTTK